MEDIVNVHKHMDCFQLSFELVCNKFNKDISPLFVDSWDFIYMESNFIFEGLMKHRRQIDFDSIKKFLGIEGSILSIHDNTSIKIIEDYILRKEIVIILIDTFYCPWHKGYKKTHIDHCCAITDINPNAFECFDLYITDKIVHLPFEEFQNGVSTALTFKRVDNNIQFNMNDLFSRIILNDKANTQMFEMMNHFAHDLSKIHEKEKLFDDMDDVYLCSIIRSLKFISDGRVQFAHLLKNLTGDNAKINKSLNELCKIMYFCGFEWQKMNNLIIKSFYLSKGFNEVLERISYKIIDISKIESDCYSTIKKMFT